MRPKQATDQVIQICELIKLYPLNKRDRSNLSNYLYGVQPRGVKDAAAAIQESEGPKLSSKTYRQLYETASGFIEADSTEVVLRCIDREFAGLRFDSDKSETDPWYIAPPLEQLAQIAESENIGCRGSH